MRLFIHFHVYILEVCIVLYHLYQVTFHHLMCYQVTLHCQFLHFNFIFLFIFLFDFLFIFSFIYLFFYFFIYLFIYLHTYVRTHLFICFIFLLFFVTFFSYRPSISNHLFTSFNLFQIIDFLYSFLDF